LLLTQEFLAQMLAVERSSVSIVAGTLQQADLIRCSRGHIEIIDVDEESRYPSATRPS
jgi:CRP-like cAMP-binding protein